MFQVNALLLTEDEEWQKNFSEYAGKERPPSNCCKRNEEDVRSATLPYLLFRFGYRSSSTNCSPDDCNECCHRIDKKREL